MTPLTREQIAGLRELIVDWRQEAAKSDMWLDRPFHAARRDAFTQCADQLEAVLPLAGEVSGNG